jgi:GAF domain-containing protein
MARPGLSGADLEDMAPWGDWPSAVDGVLEFLYGHVGWDVWLATRVEGDHLVVLDSRPQGRVPPGTAIPWESTLCRQMYSGEAPRIATVTAVVPAYAALCEGPFTGVAAYLGVPLVTRHGQLFGTLCAHSPIARSRGGPSVICRWWRPSAGC